MPVNTAYISRSHSDTLNYQVLEVIRGLKETKKLTENHAASWHNKKTPVCMFLELP